VSLPPPSAQPLCLISIDLRLVPSTDSPHYG
jgi:hypothetical protein